MYQLTENGVIRIVDNAQIPKAEGNRDWIEFQAWVAEGNEATPIAGKTPEQIQTELTQVLDGHLDVVAAERQYDNRFTCALRAGYPGPFQEEGQTFAAWMDTCNMVAYNHMVKVKAGEVPVPSKEELIALLPVIQWPVSPIPEGA